MAAGLRWRLLDTIFDADFVPTRYDGRANLFISRAQDNSQATHCLTFVKQLTGHRINDDENALAKALSRDGAETGTDKRWPAANGSLQGAALALTQFK